MARRHGVLQDRTAHEERQDARAEKRRVIDTAVSRCDLRPAVRRNEAPQERQVDRRVRTAEIDPVDDTAESAFVDQEVARVEVAVDDAVEARRW